MNPIKKLWKRLVGFAPAIGIIILILSLPLTMYFESIGLFIIVLSIGSIIYMAGASQVKESILPPNPKK